MVTEGCRFEAKRWLLTELQYGRCASSYKQVVPLGLVPPRLEHAESFCLTQSR